MLWAASLAGLAMAAHAQPAVSYNGFTKNIEGNMPYVKSATYIATAPAGSWTGPRTVHFIVVPNQPVPLVGSATAASYISIAPVTFTGPGNSQNVTVVASMPTFPSLPPGDSVTFGYQVYTTLSDWGIAGVTDTGFGINVRVVSPPPDPAGPPVVTIVTPNQELYSGYQLSDFPITLPLKFNAVSATLDVDGNPIADPDEVTSIYATLNGQPLKPPAFPGSANPNNWVESGLGTVSAQGTADLHIPGPGVYTVFASGSNSQGPGQATFQFTVQATGLPPTTAIQKPVTNSDFVYYVGGDNVVPEVKFSASSQAGAPLISWTAALEYPDGHQAVQDISFDAEHSTSLNWFGSVPLALNVSGKYRLLVTARNMFGSSTQAETTFWINRITNPLSRTIKVSENTSFYAAADGRTSGIYLYQWGRLIPGTGFVPLADGGYFGGTNSTTLTVTNAALSLSGSQYVCRVTVPGSNITFDSAPATLTVTKPTPAISWSPTGFVYGTKLSATQLNATSPTPGTYTYSPADGTLLAAGTRTLSVTLTPDDTVNYDSITVARDIVVTPAPLQVKAASVTMDYGASLPPLSATYSGFVNGENANSAFTTLPVLSTAPGNSAPGTYTISVGGGVAPNYTVTYIPGTLTINPAAGSRVTIAGSVYFDVNVNHTRDADEPALPDVQVALRSSTNALIATTTTAANGSYSFQADAQTSYYVTVSVPSGLTPSTSTELSVTTGLTNPPPVTTGLALNLSAIRDMSACGNTIGYWKNNLSKAAAGRATGTQETLDMLCNFTNAIRGYALGTFSDLPVTSPTTKSGLNQPATILSSTSSDPASLLKKQLLASEYNYARGSYINDNASLTYLFLYWGEYVLEHASAFGSTYTLWTKDWFDAYNNSHCGVVAGPAPLGSTALAADFNATAIPAGGYLWFNAVAAIDGRGGKNAVVEFNRSSVQLVVNGTPVAYDVPDTIITFSSTVLSATALYDDTTDTWRVSVPAGYTGNVFIGGVAVKLPAGLPGGIKGVQWTGRFTSYTDGLTATWKWAAAAYTQLNDADLNAVGAKPIDGSKLNLYSNSDLAGTPELFKPFVIGGARGGGGSNWTGSYSGTSKLSVALPVSN